MASDDIIVINQGYELRTSKTGKTRATIVVKAEPVVIATDPKALGAPVALAIAETIKQKIKGITQRASEATLTYRQFAAKALPQGVPWATKRYSGGKTGTKPPAQSEAAFNDSGRLADGITANASSDGSWRVNVPANRLTADTSGGIARIWAKLTALVPELANPLKLLETPTVRQAIDKSLEYLLHKERARTSQLNQELLRAWLNLGRSLVSAVGGGG